MTAIVGVCDGPRVWLGADSCVTNNGSRETLGTPKLWRSGAYLIGVAGSSAWHTLARRVAMPAVASTGYMLPGWPEDLLAAARALGIDGLPTREDDDPLDGCALVAGAGALWYVDSALECYRVERETAIGTGADAARGALHVARGSAKRRVRLALEAAALVCTDVAAPFVITAV